MIDRADLVSQVAEQVRQLIVSGELAGGARINETRLSKHLQVSRTPVREALRRLAGEGAVVSMPHLGFFVAEMSAAELDEIYVLRPQLDLVALRMGKAPLPNTMDRMKRVNDALARAKSAEAAVDLDNQWHRLLLSGCSNSMLIGFIERLIDRTRRYELLLFGNPDERVAAARQHEAVTDALRRGSLDDACAALAANLTRGDEPLRAAIRDKASERA